MTLTEVFTFRPKVSRAEALREIRKHGASEAEFFADCGDKTEYDGASVLEWLGY